MFGRTTIEVEAAASRGYNFQIKIQGSDGSTTRTYQETFARKTFFPSLPLGEIRSIEVKQVPGKTSRFKLKATRQAFMVSRIEFPRALSHAELYSCCFSIDVTGKLSMKEPDRRALKRDYLISPRGDHSRTAKIFKLSQTQTPQRR